MRLMITRKACRSTWRATCRITSLSGAMRRAQRVARAVIDRAVWLVEPEAVRLLVGVDRKRDGRERVTVALGHDRRRILAAGEQVARADRVVDRLPVHLHDLVARFQPGLV